MNNKKLCVSAFFIAVVAVACVGAVIINAMAVGMPPSEFVITDKQVVEKEYSFLFWTFQDKPQYIMYYSDVDYVYTTEESYNSFDVGEVFKGPIIVQSTK